MIKSIDRKLSSMHIVSVTGENAYAIPGKEEAPVTPEFVDQNIYHYHLIEGRLRLKGITLGPGWESRKIKPGKLSCYQGKGDEKMGREREHTLPEPQRLKELWKECGTINAVARKLGVSWARANNWLIQADIINSLGQPSDNEAKEGDLPLEPDQATNQKPERNESESAIKSISEVKAGVNEERLGENNNSIANNSFAVEDEELTPYTANQELSPLASAGNQVLVTAWDKIRAVIDDPVALALIKELIRRGAA